MTLDTATPATQEIANSRFDLGSGGHGVAMEVQDGRLHLLGLFGMPCVPHDMSAPRRVRGTVSLATDKGRIEADDLRLTTCRAEGNTLTAEFEDREHAVRVRSLWRFCPHTGMLSRADSLTNIADQAMVVHRCHARFSFMPGPYELYTQESRWCAESRGSWTSVPVGALHLSGEWGRTSQGNTPYACLRHCQTGNAVCFHLRPKGNWAIRVARHTTLTGPGIAVIEMGLADHDLRMSLAAGAVIDLPEVLVGALPEGQPERGVPALHRYILANSPPAKTDTPPVVYNTWFDRFDDLQVPHLHTQLAAAREVGCEVFTIDAGWYGQQPGPWVNSAGDWQEKLQGAFHGDMKAFADAVRAAGLGFGLWMEPERFARAVPVRQEHPDWFLPADADMARIDLENPEAAAYQEAEICRLVETYDLAWMKVDFNLVFEVDNTGAELYHYRRLWDDMLDRIRKRYPQTFFEGCSSGAMCLDLNSQSHFDAHFLTDTVNPLHVLRITQGSWLRLLPGRLTRWCVLRRQDTDSNLQGPCGAGWNDPVPADLDVSAIAALPGILGLSGDLASLLPAERSRLADFVAFYKTWRPMINRAAGHLLTPAQPMTVASGWIGLQLQDTEGPDSLIFAYGLHEQTDAITVAPRDLEGSASYEIRRVFPEAGTVDTLTGDRLMDDGIRISPPDNREHDMWACVYALERSRD